MLYIILNLEKNYARNILVYRNKWSFFYSAILKYVPLNEGVQPATKWHTDKMRNKFKKI